MTVCAVYLRSKSADHLARMHLLSETFERSTSVRIVLSLFKNSIFEIVLF